MANPLIILVALSLIVIVLRYRDLRFYQTLYETAGYRPNEINRRYTYLREQGVRCRLQNTTSKMGVIVHGGSELGTTIRLLVHKKDFNQAEAIMVDYKKCS
ncbi:hypothetical protein [Alkalibacillus silvisoli]|uniref:DUF2007 domain-containing protein n=1 Tax=Alkalibacillus silvisoli TaxID=392823 RepID=A0ABN0ZV85_9BACI